MAKAFKQMKQEWAVVKKELDEIDDELSSAAESRGVMDGVIEEGAKEVGRRVRELRENGVAGATLNDFKDEKEVKLMLKSLNEGLAGIEKNLVRVKTQLDGAWRKPLLGYTELEKGLLGEIVTRKKEISSKIGLGNKSLPDMEKLLKEMQGYSKTVQRISEYPTKKLPKIEKYEKSMQDWLKEQVELSKAIAYSRDQSEKFDRLMVDRNLAKNFGHAKGLYTKIKELVDDGKQAKAQNRVAELATARASVDPLLNELVNLNNDYTAAAADVGEAALKNAKNFDKIDKAMKGIEQMTALSKSGREALN